jgi:hypothetical protein
MYVYYYDDGLRWLITDDEHDYIMMMYLLYSYDCLLESSSFRLHLYYCIVIWLKRLHLYSYDSNIV